MSAYATPGILFQNPTYQSGAVINVNDFPINITSVDTLDHYVFLKLNSTLLGWWRFEGDYNDESGNGNHGTCSDCPAALATARFGAGYNFSSNNNITIPATASINRAQNEFAISVWVNPNPGYGIEDSGHIDIISRWGQAGINNAAYMLALNSTGHVQLWTHNGTSSSNLASPGPIPVGQWTHLVGTREGSTMRIYINGVQASTLSNSVNPQSSQYPIHIGLEPVGGNDYNGSIDEFLLFSKSIYPEEVSALYNASANQFYHYYMDWPDGRHNYTAYAVNTNAETNQTDVRNITIDTVPPQAQLQTPTTPSGNHSSQGQTWVQVNVSATDVGTGISNITIRLYTAAGLYDSRISTSSPFFYNFTGLPGDTYFFNATAMDYAGNSNTTETRNATTAPLPAPVPEFGTIAIFLALGMVAVGLTRLRRS